MDDLREAGTYPVMMRAAMTVQKYYWDHDDIAKWV
jgi:hypothetical protein